MDFAFVPPDVCSIVAFCTFPSQTCHHLSTARIDRCSGGQVKKISLDPSEASLRLTEPTREEGNIYGVDERLLFFVNIKRAGIGNVSSCFFDEFFRRKLPAAGAHELRRHISVGRVHNNTLRLFAKRAAFRRSIYGGLDVRDKSPSAGLRPRSPKTSE